MRSGLFAQDGAAPQKALAAFRRGALRCVIFFLAVAVCFGATLRGAAAQGACPDTGAALPKECTKDILIYNNTDGPIWPIVQGSIQLTDALNCTKAGKGGGDVWLQAALGKADSCFAVKSDYYAFINPGVGIQKGGFVSVKVPWWSKQTATAQDRYIDWWRGGRVIIFDDKTAELEIYNKVKGKNPLVAYAAGSPKLLCDKSVTGSSCNMVQPYQVSAGTGISAHLPFQLNEYTFADVAKVTDNGMKGGDFIDFNQNYNVSNVDQTYLPLAMEPIRDPADVGYMGTTLSVQAFRQQLEAFTMADADPANPVWPVYNNPLVDGKKMYPDAGIRVPSTATVFAFYQNPSSFPDGKTLEIIPKDPPKLVQDIMNQWTDCTSASPKNCPESAQYKAINSLFLDSYQSYATTCPNIPAYLQPVSQNPPMPKLTAYLFPIYGWVPFNVGCGNKELPTVDGLPTDGGHAVIDYFQIQYNYQNLSLTRPQWFNPYTQLIHDSVDAGGLLASAYAFSIDDHASFLSNSGGTLPGGLIFAVGGAKGLVNGKQHAPPVPPVYKWYSFSLGLGAPGPTGPYWSKYGICSATADIPFPEEEKGGVVLGVDPAINRIDAQNPCPITLEDTAGRKYQIVILRAQAPGTALPQKPIWPAFEPSAGKNFDPVVVACPALAGFVKPDVWCDFSNEVARLPANPMTDPGFYTIGARSPLP